MARFYARFDGNAEGELDGTFIRRRIAATSASGATLRDGLIASRSLISADIYADLDSVNRDGSRGIYFPPTSSIYSTDNSTFVSWSNAYTSSFDGIKIPVTNTYGGAAINYSKRPTGSVTTTDTTIIGPASPVDSVGASYTTYVSASIAVRDVLLSVVTGSAEVGKSRGATSTPYGRLGLDPVRTVHSIWHNPNLDYFAWDDFTPGSASFGPPASQTAGGITSNPATDTCSPPYSATYKTLNLGVGTATTAQFLFELGSFEYTPVNDLDKVGFRLVLTSFSNNAFDSQAGTGPNGNGTYIIDLKGGVGNNPSQGPFVIGSDISGDGPVSPRTGVSSSWAYTEANKTLTWSIDLVSGSYTIESQGIVLYDELIPAHTAQVEGTYQAILNGTGCGGNRFVVTDGNIS